MTIFTVRIGVTELSVIESVLSIMIITCPCCFSNILQYDADPCLSFFVEVNDYPYCEQVHKQAQLPRRCRKIDNGLQGADDALQPQPVPTSRWEMQ